MIRRVSASRRSQPSRSTGATPRKRPQNGAVNAPDPAESPNQLTIEQLAQESGMTVRNIRSHQARGLLAPPEVRMRIGYYGPEHVVSTGISPKGGVEILEEVDKHCAAIAHSFVRLFLREVWRPFQDAGMPADQWPEIEAAIERLRPLASDAMLGVFQQRMDREI